MKKQQQHWQNSHKKGDRNVSIVDHLTCQECDFWFESYQSFESLNNSNSNQFSVGIKSDKNGEVAKTFEINLTAGIKLWRKLYFELKGKRAQLEMPKKLWYWL